MGVDKPTSWHFSVSPVQLLFTAGDRGRCPPPGPAIPEQGFRCFLPSVVFPMLPGSPAGEREGGALFNRLPFLLSEWDHSPAHSLPSRQHHHGTAAAGSWGPDRDEDQGESPSEAPASARVSIRRLPVPEHCCAVLPSTYPVNIVLGHDRRSLVHFQCYLHRLRGGCMHGWCALETEGELTFALFYKQVTSLYSLLTFLCPC